MVPTAILNELMIFFSIGARSQAKTIFEAKCYNVGNDAIQHFQCRMRDKPDFKSCASVVRDCKSQTAVILPKQIRLVFGPLQEF
jgi:hypothetical protein